MTPSVMISVLDVGPPADRAAFDGDHRNTHRPTVRRRPGIGRSLAR